jgi:hypothetical protein
LRVSRERQEAARAAESFAIEVADASGMIVGETELAGKPDELAAKLAAILAREGLGPLGPVKILTCDRGGVAFESAGPAPGPPGAGGSAVRRGRVQLAPQGSRTLLRYAIEAPGGRVLLGIGWAVAAVGLVALVAGCFLELVYVVPSPSGAVRAQAFQMIQVIHFLWPPFLFGFLSRQPTRFLRARWDALIHNLPYA